MMNHIPDSGERAVELGKYIVNYKATVRMTAAATGISKSTVHKEVSKRLREKDYPLYLRVRDVLELNKSERHIRGGNATREKYRRLAEADGRLNQKKSQSSQKSIE